MTWRESVLSFNKSEISHWIKCVLQGPAGLPRDVSSVAFSHLSVFSALAELILTTVSLLTRDALGTVVGDRKLP